MLQIVNYVSQPIGTAAFTFAISVSGCLLVITWLRHSNQSFFLGQRGVVRVDAEWDEIHRVLDGHRIPLSGADVTLCPYPHCVAPMRFGVLSLDGHAKVIVA